MTNRISTPFHYTPDSNGEPVPGGLLYTHAAGTLDDLATYLDEDGTPNTNPVVMDADGKATVILDGNYRLIFRDALGNLIYDVDEVGSEDLVEWINCRAATFVSSTIVTIPGDQTANYQVGRGVKFNNNPALVYSTCASVSYDAGPDATTITVNDAVITSGVVDVCTSVVGPDSKLTQTLEAALAASTGGTLIGTTGSSTVQADIDARILTSSLSASAGAALIGATGGGTVQAGLNNIGTELLNVTPIGGTLLWPTGTPPTNYLECDGATFSAGTYAALNTLLGGNTLPDVRGEFMRGWDNGRGVDSGRAILSAQGEQLLAHTHNVYTHAGDPAGSSANGAGGGDAVNTVTDGVTSSTGGGENRPRSVAFMLIMRAL